MENLNRLLEINVYAVLLFFIVMIIKKIFKHKLSPRLHFVIWFILIARLCIPFTIDSGIRPIVIPEKTISAFKISTDGQLQLSPSLGWTDFFLIVWLGGIVLLSIRLIVSMARVNREIKEHSIQPSSHTQEILDLCCNELNIRKKIRLFLFPGVTTPAITIGFKPKLILPTNIHECLSEKQLELAIKHELMHYKRRDHLIVLLLGAIKVIYWFNPVVWLMDRYISLDMESACDSMVVRNLDDQQKRNYALSLVQLSSKGTLLKSVLGLVLGNNEKIVEQRVRGVFQKYLRKRGVIVATGVIAVALFIGCFTNIFQPLVKTEIADKTVRAEYVTEVLKEPTVIEKSEDVDYKSHIFFYTTDDSVRDATGSIIGPELIDCYVVATTENGSLDGIATDNGLNKESLAITDTNEVNYIMTTKDMAATIGTNLRYN